METINTSVIIVGGGPVGVGLAIELGQRAISTVVIERQPTPQRIPKGQNLTQRTMEHFHAWGAESAVRQARTIPKDYGIGGLTAFGTLLSGFTYDWLARELVRDFYLVDNERLPQYLTEEVLRDRLAELSPAKTLYGWTAESVRTNDDGAVVMSRQAGTGNMVRVEGNYVVGCDGSRSLVARECGLIYERSDHDRRMVLLVFTSRELHELLLRFPGKSFFNVLHPSLRGYWQFFGRVDLEGRWFFHAPVPRGTTQDNFDFAGYLQSAVGAPFSIEIEHAGFWDLRFETASRYRRGRAFVAGDAAHSHPPYGGYGINTGFEDARNLGWKLAAVFQGWGGETLLDTYDEERRPVFASTARDFIERSINDDRDFLAKFDPEKNRAAFEAAWSGRAQGAKKEVGSFEPNYDGSRIVYGNPGAQPSALGMHTFKARAGHHLAPRRLAGGDNVFSRLGPGFTLLSINGDETVEDGFRAASDRLGLPLTVVSEPHSTELADYGCRYVLVRPDQFVAWTGEGAAGRETEILRRCAAQRPGSV